LNAIIAKRFGAVLCGIIFGIIACGPVVTAAPMIREAIIWLAVIASDATVAIDASDSAKTAIALHHKPIAAFIADYEYGKPYVIVSTYDNTFVLKRRGTVIRTGKCSTGSYILLKSRDHREWIFHTPRGRFTILNKMESPIWHMPDWAFIEDGKAVPPPGSLERNEEGVLGDYALNFGDGYMIHGTLYQRFLGLPVTHGCVRLADEDLKTVYKNLEIGSHVFIY
jgi:L,D-transpeptidase ErfK/SrfK